MSDRLAELSGMQEIFFCNSGCEANEAAIELARLYGHGKKVDSPMIVDMMNSVLDESYPGIDSVAIVRNNRLLLYWYEGRRMSRG